MLESDANELKFWLYLLLVVLNLDTFSYFFQPQFTYSTMEIMMSALCGLYKRVSRGSPGELASHMRTRTLLGALAPDVLTQGPLELVL